MAIQQQVRGPAPQDELVVMDAKEPKHSSASRELSENNAFWATWRIHDNKQQGRSGTLWAERFKSVVVEDQPGAVQPVAAYVDLNPVRVGLPL